MTRVLILDGHNLAYFLYPIAQGGKVSQAEIKSLILHVGQYVRAYSAAVQVELCLDYLPFDLAAPKPAGLAVFAEPGRKADDLIRERVWFHHYHGRDVLIVSNDEELREWVHEEGGAHLSVSDFVRRPAPAPVFRAPAELDAFLHPARKPKKRSTATPNPSNRASAAASAIFSPPAAPAAVSRTNKLTMRKEKAQPSEPAPPPPPPTPLPPAEPQPTYRLTPLRWLPAEGGRFLLDSFCPLHNLAARELRRLLRDSPPNQADLQHWIAELLASCGNEPDFATHGALMNRVRRALLQAPQFTLPLDELVRRTGLPCEGLPRHIREKAGLWLEILIE